MSIKFSEITFFYPLIVFICAFNQVHNSVNFDDFDDDFQPAEMFFESQRISNNGAGSSPINRKILTTTSLYSEKSDDEPFPDFDYADGTTTSTSTTITTISSNDTRPSSNESTTIANNSSTMFAKRWGFIDPPPNMPLKPLIRSDQASNYFAHYHHQPNQGMWPIANGPMMQQLRAMESVARPNVYNSHLNQLFDRIRFAESKASPTHVDQSNQTDNSAKFSYASYGKRNKPLRIDNEPDLVAIKDDTMARSDGISAPARHEPSGMSSKKELIDYELATVHPQVKSEHINGNSDNYRSEQVSTRHYQGRPQAYSPSTPLRSRPQRLYSRAYNQQPPTRTAYNRQEDADNRINTVNNGERVRPRTRQYRARPMHATRQVAHYPHSHEAGDVYSLTNSIPEGMILPTIDNGLAWENEAPLVANEFSLIPMQGRAPFDPSVGDTYPLIGGPNPMPPFHFPIASGSVPMSGGNFMPGKPATQMDGQSSHHQPQHQQQPQQLNGGSEVKLSELQKMHPGLHPVQYQYLSQWYSYLNQPSIRSYIDNFKDPNESNEKKTTSDSSNNSEDKSGSRWFRNLKIFPLSLNKIQLPRVREIIQSIRGTTSTSTTESSTSPDYAS